MFPQIFALALIISETKNKMFDLQKVGQGHGMQFSQLQHSMANVKITNVSHNFCASSHRFRDIKILFFLPPIFKSRREKWYLPRSIANV